MIDDCEPEWVSTLPGDPGESVPFEWRRQVPVYYEHAVAVDLPDIDLFCG